MFKKVNLNQNFSKLEEKILAYWDAEQIFQKSLEKNKGQENFVFYEGPPTANGRPGIHHVLARAFKDLFPRYKTMRGYYVARKAGWDTHGLPVELEVEKKLDISGKPDIEDYGVEEFNKQCKESVWEYQEEWEKLTRRIAFWVDMENPYVTYDPAYIETLWWIVKRIWEKDLLYQGYKVVPYCPRCGTSLSSHEVSQGYKEVDDPSIFVRFKIKSGALKDLVGGEVSFLVWTTTPWTLPGNVALAVGKKIDYVLVKYNDDYLVLAKDRLEVLGENYEVLKEMKGKELVGIEYEPLYEFVKPEKKAYFLISADFVSVEDGTGIVHIAPAFGVDDMRVSQENDLPVLLMVDKKGEFVSAVKPWAGKFVKEADKDIKADLKNRALLWRAETIRHSYPFCWRCDTPLLYYATSSWFIAMTKVRGKLLKNNEEINWVPEHIKHGRFGRWLEGVVDWAISRERYWGTPLPVWICQDCQKEEVIGSFEELKEKQVGEDELTDPHRPYIDEVKLKCQCGGEMKRVSEVMDCWFDSGSMPFAQNHYPFADPALIDDQIQYPADFIAEAVDQTRGWFYTLLAVSTLLSKGPSYKNVICLGHIQDEHGRKMSKSKGNVINPWEVIDQYGVDALRWYLYTVNHPGEPKRFSEKGLREVVQNVILKIWNTYSFLSTYGRIDGWEPGSEFDWRRERSNLLDRWMVSRLSALISEVTERLDSYDVIGAAKEIEGYIDDLSNWYVRRSRRRFWKSENDEDKNEAYAVLYGSLVELSKLTAPFMPFLSEEIYRGLTNSESVHLADFPETDKKLVDEKLNEAMALTRRVVKMGHSARDEAGIKVRQPLSEIIFWTADKELNNLWENFEKSDLGFFGGLMEEELNVKKATMVKGEEVPEVERSIKLNFALVGKRLGAKIPEIQSQLKRGNWEIKERVLKVAGEELGEEEFEEMVTAGEEGWIIKGEGGLFVALRTEISDELWQEGVAREIVRRIQELRKEADYQVDDRIKVYYDLESLPEKYGRVFKNFGDYIQKETLAASLESGLLPEVDQKGQVPVEEGKILLGVKK